MKLSRADSSALILGLTEAIDAASLSQYGYINFTDKFEERLREGLSSELLSAFDKIADDGGLISFVRHEFMLLIFSANEGPPEKSDEKLTNYSAFHKPLEAAKLVVNNMRDLPYEYAFFVRASPSMGRAFSRNDVNLRINDQLSIVSGSELIGRFKTASDNDRIDQYLRSGRAGLSDQLRAFYGCCLAYNVLFNYNFDFEDFQPVVFADKISGGDMSFAHTARAEDDIRKTTNYFLSSKCEERIKGGVTLEILLEPMLKMFQSDEHARLSTAAIWVQRAHISARGMDRVLESTIALEVLLGDRETSDRIGLSKLMANRCAYALGNTAKERREIADFFNTFYKVRSEIVHSGRFKLSDDEKDIVSKGLNLASRMLKHEVALA